MNEIEKLGITKRPWEVTKCKCGSHVCNKYGINALYIESSALEEPDARLISAAPEMLEALIENVINEKGIDCDYEISIIEKATGKKWEEIKEITNA